MKEKYKPIDCNYYDLLLDRATRKVGVELVYFSEGERILKSCTFKDVYTKKGEEFLLLGTGELIRLDQIISVDGIEPPKNGSCEI